MSETKKDNYKTERERIRSTVRAKDRNLIVEFDDARVPNWIKFRIDDPATGAIIGVSGEEHVSVIADWTEDHLAQYVSAISNNRI